MAERDRSHQMMIQPQDTIQPGLRMIIGHCHTPLIYFGVLAGTLHLPETYAEYCQWQRAFFALENLGITQNNTPSNADQRQTTPNTTPEPRE